MELEKKIIPYKTVYENDSYGIKLCNDKETMESICIVGNVGCLQNNIEYRVILKKKTHPKYGEQYELISVPSLDDIEISDEDEISVLLSVMNEAQANKVHEAYPRFVQMIINGEEDKIDTGNIKGVGKKRLNEYIDKISGVYKYQKIINAFPKYDLNLNDCKKLFKRYYSLDKIKNELDENPYYILINVLEKSFLKANSVIIENKPELLGSKLQTEYLLLYVLGMNENEGNTKVNANVAAYVAKDIVPECVPMMKETAENSSLIFYDNNTKFMAKMDTYEAEVNISNELLRRLKDHKNLNIKWEKYKGFLSDEQANVLKAINEKNIVVLCGPAGSGKTSSVKALINMLDKESLTYELLAPTGISAKRLADVTERFVQTIHKELALQTYITQDVLIVDEFSFVGVKLFAQLLKNVSPETKILLVCDDEQLPSISCGSVIKDIFKANIIPTIKLTKIFRYGDNALLTVATDIRNKKPYLNETGCIFDGHKDSKEYVFIKIDKDPLEQIMEQYKNVLQKYKQSDIIILSPFNIGDFGTYSINNKIQDTYNPLIGEEEIIKSVQTSHGATKVHYRKGDRVINTKNIYHAVTPSEFYDIGLKEGSTTVVNGDIGIVKKVDLENKCLIIDFSENTVVFTFHDLAHLLLGYAISTHKSQGSEFPVVINIVHPQHSKMLTKNLLYVANTRAKELLIEIGDVATINKGIQIEATEGRETFLYELLTN
nr:MAG TPA: ATP dependent DNA helicase [Caudoviricetes sp.]